MNSSSRWLLLAVFSLLLINSASAHYNPRHGRWLSRDPIGEEGGFNLYAYCGNDPINRHDPLGLSELWIVGNRNDGFKLGETRRLNNGVPEVRYGEKASWKPWDDTYRVWWQHPSGDELARFFRRTPTGWRYSSGDEREQTWLAQADAAVGPAMDRTDRVINRASKAYYGSIALVTAPWMLLEGGLTWGTAIAAGHETYAGVSMWAGAINNENYATSPEGWLVRQAGGPEWAASSADALAGFGSPFFMGRGPQMQMPGPTWNPLNYRMVPETRMFMGVGLPKLRCVGPVSPVPELRISASLYPDLAENILNAQRAGRPITLTYGGNTVANRAQALKDVPTISPFSRDEYPFASSLEGGDGAWVGHIPAIQQNAQGALLKNFLMKNKIKPGDQYQVIIVP
jgi:hypothetical protein